MVRALTACPFDQTHAQRLDMTERTAPWDKQAEMGIVVSRWRGWPV